MTFDTLVLSGNSTNAVKTMGALQRLLDKGVVVKSDLTTLIGTSSGSLVATLLAIDVDPIEALSHLCANKSFQRVPTVNLVNVVSAGGGLMDFDHIETEFTRIVMAKLGYVPTLRQMHERYGKTVVYVTFDMTGCRKEYVRHETFPDLPVTKACRMSCSFPFVFAPFEYTGRFYVDGGVVDNFAINYAVSLGGRCVGLYNANEIKPYTRDTSYARLFFTLFCVFVCSSAENAAAVCGDRAKIFKLKYEAGFFDFTPDTAELVRMFDYGYDNVE